MDRKKHKTSPYPAEFRERAVQMARVTVDTTVQTKAVAYPTDGHPSTNDRVITSYCSAGRLESAVRIRIWRWRALTFLNQFRLVKRNHRGIVVHGVSLLLKVLAGLITRHDTSPFLPPSLIFDNVPRITGVGSIRDNFLFILLKDKQDHGL